MKNADRAAFGHVAMTESNGWHEQGLTKREYFAAMAMQGLLSNSAVNTLLSDDKAMQRIQIAETATECADALLSELEKEQK